jgi:uncharacterized protein
VGGFLESIPLLAVVIVIWVLLALTVFRHVVTPPHPIERMLGARRLTFWVATLIAVVLAPLVEETAFRGMLYNGLRGVMGVWPSAVISGALFAAIHPTMPAAFLPILVLGFVLAVLRETTGSLYPSMICHGLYNGSLILIFRLVHG